VTAIYTLQSQIKLPVFRQTQIICNNKITQRSGGLFCLSLQGYEELQPRRPTATLPVYADYTLVNAIHKQATYYILPSNTVRYASLRPPQVAFVRNNYSLCLQATVQCL
jgi:hypothetical protein